MTTTPTPCAPSPVRDTSPPPPSATRSARKRYWEDTVHDAIAELRQRLGSTRESVVTLALLTIIEVEKHKMRHGRPVSGTETCHMREDEDPHPLPRLAPLDEPRHSEPEASATVFTPPTPVAAGREVGITAPPTATVPIPVAHASGSEGTVAHASGSEGTVAHASGSDRPPHDPTAGTICNFRPTDDRIPERRPTRADERRRTERDRAAYIRCYGRYPEDDFPDNPDYHRFRKEARPHKSFLIYLATRYGTGDDTLPLGTEDTPNTAPAVPLGPWRPDPEPPR